MIVAEHGNLRSHPYRGLSVQEVTIPLDATEIRTYLLGREVYRRTDYLALRNQGDTALVSVRKASTEPLFSPVTDVDILALPTDCLWIDDPMVDVGNATALARTAIQLRRPGIHTYVVQGRFEHVNFIHHPVPVEVRVGEVVPPHPPKLLAQAQQVREFDEDLPPITLTLEAVEVADLARQAEHDELLLPCRGSGAQVRGRVHYLDTRPEERRDWTLVGCERSLQFHQHFYGDQPPQVDLCPLGHATLESEKPLLTKCCLLERGVVLSDGLAVVPWGANLDEIRIGLRHLVGLEPPEAPTVTKEPPL